MIKILIYALVFYVGYTLISAIKRSLSAPKNQAPAEKSREGETMERDPQCGTYVPRGDAIHKSIHGTTHYFCSNKCRDDYLAANK